MVPGTEHPMNPCGQGTTLFSATGLGSCHEGHQRLPAAQSRTVNGGIFYVVVWNRQDHLSCPSRVKQRKKNEKYGGDKTKNEDYAP